jgi:hypothetical protein
MAYDFDFNPATLLRKAVLALTKNGAETSETPEFSELKTRHYRAKVGEVYTAAIQVSGRWLGWRITSREKNLGSMAAIKVEFKSLVLGGNTCELAVWFSEEKNADGVVMTTVNAKSVSDVQTNGDLGENRRVIAFFLFALDEEVIENKSIPIKPDSSQVQTTAVPNAQASAPAGVSPNVQPSAQPTAPSLEHPNGQAATTSSEIPKPTSPQPPRMKVAITKKEPQKTANQ